MNCELKHFHIIISKHWLNIIRTKTIVTRTVHQLTFYFVTQSVESMAMVPSSTRTRIAPVLVSASAEGASSSSSASSALVATSSSSGSNPGATIASSAPGVAAVAKAKAKSKAKAKAKAHALPPVIQIRGQHMGPLATVNKMGDIVQLPMYAPMGRLKGSFLNAFDTVVTHWRDLRLAQRTHRVVNGFPMHTATHGSKMEFDQ